MKKNHFNHVTGIMMNSLLLILIASSCTKETADATLTANSEEIATASAGGNPNALPIVSLRVTINDAPGYNITSDGQSDYLNSTDYVQAIFDQYGTFAFNTFSPPTKIKNATVKRWVTYNFNNPVDPNNTYRPSPNNTKNYHFSTGPSSLGTYPFIPLQNLGVNGNPTTECIYMGNGIYNNTTAWRVSFHKGLEDVATSPTAFAVVTRTSISPPEWTITPIGSCISNSNVAALRSDATGELYGYYYIPFFFTLKAQ